MPIDEVTLTNIHMQHEATEDDSTATRLISPRRWGKRIRTATLVALSLVVCAWHFSRCFRLTLFGDTFSVVACGGVVQIAGPAGSTNGSAWHDPNRAVLMINQYGGREFGFILPGHDIQQVGYSASLGSFPLYSGAYAQSFWVLPIWPLAVALLIPLIFMYLHAYTLWRYPIHGCCKQCGYDLRGNASNICPECGTRAPHLPPLAGATLNSKSQSL